ncbi:MULE transposase domain, partial [Dillenia turbinata]
VLKVSVWATERQNSSLARCMDSEPRVSDTGHVLVVEIDVKQNKNNLELPSINDHETDLNPDKEGRNPQILVVDKLEDIGVQDSQSCKPSSVATCSAGVDVEHEVQGSEIPSAGECKVDVGMEMECQSLQDESGHIRSQNLGWSLNRKSMHTNAIVGMLPWKTRKSIKQVRGERDKTSKGNKNGCLAHMTILRQPNGKFHVTHFETEHNHEFVTACTAHMLPSQKRLLLLKQLRLNLVIVLPRIGCQNLEWDLNDLNLKTMRMSSITAMLGVRKIDGAVVSKRFCHREGFRQKNKRDFNVKRPQNETRIGYLAQSVIARQHDGLYWETHFEEKHNHELVPLCRIRMLHSQKRSDESQTPEDNGEDGYNIQVELISEEMDKEAGNRTNQGYCPIDYERKVHTRRMREMEGEAEAIQNYLQSKQLKNLSLFHAKQVDVDDQMANFLWIDLKMAVDYSDFGDVVCFDTMHTLNGDCRPFAYFSGVNHHKQMVILGAAFLYDETIESFKWIF